MFFAICGFGDGADAERAGGEQGGGLPNQAAGEGGEVDVGEAAAKAAGIEDLETGGAGGRPTGPKYHVERAAVGDGAADGAGGAGRAGVAKDTGCAVDTIRAGGA
jgi:hypothetical protein